MELKEQRTFKIDFIHDRLLIVQTKNIGVTVQNVFILLLQKWDYTIYVLTN